MALPDGLYDLLLTEGLARSVAALEPGSVDVSGLKGNAAEFLADAIARQLVAILDDVAGDEPDKAKRSSSLSTNAAFGRPLVIRYLLLERYRTECNIYASYERDMTLVACLSNWRAAAETPRSTSPQSVLVTYVLPMTRVSDNRSSGTKGERTWH